MKELGIYDLNIVEFYKKNIKSFNKEFVILDSPSADKLSNFSYIVGEFKSKIIIKDNKIFVDNIEIIEGDIFDVLRKIKSENMNCVENIEFLNNVFTGGYISIISYEFNKYIEDIDITTIDDLKLPDAIFVIPQLIIIRDEKKNKFYEINFTKEKFDWDFNFKNKKKLKTELEDIDYKKLKSYNVNMEKNKFYNIVKKAKEYIKAGDIFQVNLSQRFSCDIESKDQFKLYEILRDINPSPFASFAKFKEFTLISQSPERLISLNGDKVETRPIAGTRRKEDNTEAIMESELIMSEKERAEHIMLVDLERNDIGRVCEYGTVKVDELMEIEKYSHVMHIVSNVIGKLNKKYDEFDLLKAVFPGGTITGAPKIRCMEIINELEPTRRSFYTGSIGYIGFNKIMDLNIIIRSFIKKNKNIFFQVGAGIVYDSIPEREYKETINKARAMIVSFETLINQNKIRGDEE
ncbi:anthranilate synthase component I family protein [Haliovirga abyssi]|uniref:Anthranilate synthase component 1 n=1 Tax=Haliovirga abyssi TaxID=2996794 RepID=A0AAU9DK70_9FUSO|nr:anthranilate synthase component I family protein [Haliovirga abyssi]BDU50277.1 aminodeoxychorismate synthase component 1 [Haliovirga abyssi]